MITKYLNPVILFILLFSFSSLNGQNTVNIEGLVQDAQTGDPLPFANIILVGTSRGAASNFEGKFVLPDVEEGEYTLRVSFIGYRSKDQTVIIKKTGSTLLINIELEYESIESETVVIKGQAKGQLNAINTQLNSKQILNAIDAERIQELPDANVAESIARLPGISIQREGGEGNKIVIRGLSPKYNAVTVNGVRMTSTDPNDRSTDLSMISQYMLAGIEVIKAATPDQDADVLGGTVNFRIKEAPSGVSFNMLVQGGYNSLRGSLNNYKIVGGASNRFFNDRLGIIAQIDIGQADRSSHELGSGYALKSFNLDEMNEIKTNNLNLNYYLRSKKRYSGTFVLDYALSDMKVKLTNILSQVDNNNIKYSNGYNIANVSHSYHTNDNPSEITSMSNVLEFNQRLGFMSYDLSFSHSYSKNNHPNDLAFNFNELTAFQSDINIADLHPSQITQYANNNFDESHLTTISSTSLLSEERDISSTANFEFDLILSSQVSSKIKVGGKYRHKERSYDKERWSQYYNVGSEQPAKNRILEILGQDDLIGSMLIYYPGFFDNDYNSPSNYLSGEYMMDSKFADIELMHTIYDDLRTWTGYYDFAESGKKDYSGNEDYSAGYLMTDVNIGTYLNIVGGVRYERNKTTYNSVRGEETQGSAWAALTGNQVEESRTNEFWLPSIHIKYKPLEWLDVRFAYTKTLTRPNYTEILPYWFISGDNIDWRNHMLEPGRSTNYDLYFSVYENHIGLFTTGAFIKEIEGMIFNPGKQIIVDPSRFELPETALGSSISGFSENNSNPVKLWGIELDWQTHFWYLPGFLNGFVLTANYTHIFSEAKYPRTEIDAQYKLLPDGSFGLVKENIFSSYNDRLIDQPSDIANFALGYDLKGFSARVSMVYKTDVFKSTNFWSELRQATDEYIRWDLSIKQDLPYDGLQVFLNINNITEERDITLIQGTEFPAVMQHYGRTIDAGIRFRF